jgi:prepilin-type processing-associated H-X9-DG protein
MIAIADSNADGQADFAITYAVPPNRATLGRIHRNGANVLFCDGHVQWYFWEDLSVDGTKAYGPFDRAKLRMWTYDHEIE